MLPSLIARAVPTVTIPDSILAQIEISLSQLTACYFTILAGFVVYFWDILITLDDEVNFVWTRGGVFVKLLYIVNRYIPFPGLLMMIHAFNPITSGPLSDSICKATFILTMVSQNIVMLATTTIFAMRVYTIYVQKIIAQRFLLLALFLSHCAITAITIVLYREISLNMHYSPITGLCRGKRSTTATGVAYMTPTFIESVVLVMTLVHALRYPLPDLGGTKSAAAIIVHALYRDGCIYYVIILSMRLVAVVMYYHAPDALVMLFPMTEWALVSTVTSRWFLSFRKVLVLNLSPELPTGYSSNSKQFTGASISSYHVGELSSNFGSVPHHLSLSHHRQSSRHIIRTSRGETETPRGEEAYILPRLRFENISDGEIKTLVTE